MYHILRNQQGNAIVMVVISIMVIFGFAVLAVDVGNLYFNKADLQATIDAAAVAGAQNLRVAPDPDRPSGSQQSMTVADKIKQICEKYLNYNIKTDDTANLTATLTIFDVITPNTIGPLNLTVAPEKPSYTMNWRDWLSNGIAGLAKIDGTDWLRKLKIANLAYACYPPTYKDGYTSRADTITVTASRTVQLAFAPVLGLGKETAVTAKSSAAIMPRSRLNGPDMETKVPVRPWGMLESDLKNTISGKGAEMVNYAIFFPDRTGITGLFGATYSITVDGVASNYNDTTSSGYPKISYTNEKLAGWKSNFIAVDLGSADYTSNVRNGYFGPLSIGDTVTTNLSNMGTVHTLLPTKNEPPAAHDFPTSPNSFIFIVPIISDPANPAAGGQNVTIKGFAAFLLTKNPEISDGTINADLMEVIIEDPNKGNKLSLYGFGKWGITKTALTE